MNINVRDLSPAESEALLKRCKVGRLGLYDSGRKRAYVVPISYAYRDGSAYLHSAPGLKLELLHNQPGDVCLEVDDVADEGEWSSVIAWGRFEEVTDAKARFAALRLFGDRLLRGPLRDRQQVGRGGMMGGGETVFRLVLDEFTGRADSSGWVDTASD